MSPENVDSISDTDRDEMLQLPKTGVVASLITSIALGVLEEATDEAKLKVAIRTLVLVVLVPSVGVVSGLVALVG